MGKLGRPRKGGGLGLIGAGRRGADLPDLAEEGLDQGRRCCGGGARLRGMAWLCALGKGGKQRSGCWAAGCGWVCGYGRD